MFSANGFQNVLLVVTETSVAFFSLVDSFPFGHHFCGVKFEGEEPMFSKCFCLLLLFTVLWCNVAINAYNCRDSRPHPKELRCATKDVIWGWLHVINRPALRAEAVKKNVSEIMQRVRDMRNEAEELFVKYKEFHEVLKSTENKEDIALINQAIADVKDVIVQTNKSELMARDATKEADASIITSSLCFSDIIRVACFLWDVGLTGNWNYANVKEVLDQHDKDCEDKYGISKILDNTTENIDNMNLTEWKDRALHILQETYANVVVNKSRYHWTLRDGTKIKDVKDAVSDAVDRVEVAVKKFELYQIAVDEAKNKLDNASREVNNSVLASASGKVFCEIVKQFWKSDGELKVVEKTVVDAKQKVVDVVAGSEQVRAEVTAVGKVVRDVVTQMQQNHLPLVRKFAIGNNLESAAGSTTMASANAHASVRTAIDAGTTINEIQQKVKTERELLGRVQGELAKMSDAGGTKVSKATFEACNDGVSEILKNKWSDAIRRIAEFNMTLLRELNNTLQEISSTTNTVGSNLSGVNSKVKEVKSSARDASLLAKQATENVKQTTVKVLSGVVAKLCAALSELRALHDKSEAFSAHAANASANISEWLVRIDAAAKERDALVDLPTSVEDAFATAEKRLEVLERVLHRADEQRGKVGGRSRRFSGGGGEQQWRLSS
ncbi:hypothetical protein, conserved in T. vivax [Trypanosoma vivax Y486]|uniref:Uncharacterized protein n=1 Tax=Trypanosoma vivax (strain Y486) TaxID=1055687 RepID=F9WLP5_TRYVY|nr:hypothetical protein, conserved in T. vivax [Trypanosoma vivax Y486]|eukprot:CCD18437.1 hypothetical protein, conserved in T. vivax [Trypanosoma vivax Y486]